MDITLEHNVQHKLKISDKINFPQDTLKSDIKDFKNQKSVKEVMVEDNILLLPELKENPNPIDSDVQVQIENHKEVLFT